jgi:hypothetical protein
MLVALYGCGEPGGLLVVQDGGDGGGSPPSCDDGIPCTHDAAEDGGCTHSVEVTGTACTIDGHPGTCNAPDGTTPGACNPTCCPPHASCSPDCSTIACDTGYPNCAGHAHPCQTTHDCPPSLVNDPCSTLACDPMGRTTDPRSPVPGCYVEGVALDTPCAYPAASQCSGFCQAPDDAGTQRCALSCFSACMANTPGCI